MNTIINGKSQTLLPRFFLGERAAVHRLLYQLTYTVINCLLDHHLIDTNLWRFQIWRFFFCTNFPPPENSFNDITPPLLPLSQVTYTFEKMWVYLSVT